MDNETRQTKTSYIISLCTTIDMFSASDMYDFSALQVKYWDWFNQCYGSRNIVWRISVDLLRYRFPITSIIVEKHFWNGPGTLYGHQRCCKITINLGRIIFIVVSPDDYGTIENPASDLIKLIFHNINIHVPVRIVFYSKYGNHTAMLRVRRLPKRKKTKSNHGKRHYAIIVIDMDLGWSSYIAATRFGQCCADITLRVN